jgi:hypothetical protein
MAETPRPTLSVSDLFAEREAHNRREKEAEGQLKRKSQEELAAFKQRLETFQLTDQHIETVIGRIKRAFEQGATELMLTSFPSSFCTDDGRAITNVGVPPINKPDEEDPKQSHEPPWLATACRCSSDLRLLEKPPRAGWLQFQRPHHQLPKRQARRCRPLLFLAQQCRRNRSLADSLRDDFASRYVSDSRVVVRPSIAAKRT